MKLHDAVAMRSKKGNNVFYEEPIVSLGIIEIHISAIRNDLSGGIVLSSSRSAPKLSPHKNLIKHFKRSTNG